MDTSGLADDVSDGAFDDSTSDDDGGLFDAEMNDGAGPDGGSDATLDGAAEAEADAEADADAAVDADAAPDADAIVDTEPDGDASMDVGGDVLDETGDAATDAPTEGGTVLTSTPGKVSCSGSSSLCSTPDVCCGRVSLLPPFDWSWSCAGSCIAGRGYDCDEAADCSGGKICCASTAPFSSTINGSSCASSCGGAQLCMTDAECGGKSCVPQKAPDGSQTIGVCK